jgi:ribosomal protein S18 acetylase RimI-like enzyme
LGRAVEQVGPFLATFSLTTDNPYLSYAIPDDGASPDAGDVGALVDAYKARRRVPRLEYVPEVAPLVEHVLLDSGFVVEGRLPIMVTDAQASVQVPIRSGIELVAPSSDDDLYAMALAQAEAYGETVLPTRGVVGDRRASLAAGAIAIVARDLSTGSVVGAGSCSPIRDGLTEVASIGVITSHRQRGIGTALAGRLATEAMRAGAVTPWLMAAHEAERRAYERAGYRTIGEMLHISR